MFDIKKDADSHVLAPDDVLNANRSEPRLDDDAAPVKAEPFTHTRAKRSPQQPVQTIEPVASTDKVKTGKRPVVDIAAGMSMGASNPINQDAGQPVVARGMSSDLADGSGEPRAARFERISDSDKQVPRTDINNDTNDPGHTIDPHIDDDAALIEPVSSDTWSAPDDENGENTPQYGLPVDTRNSSPKLGAILIANGKMTEQTVASVLELQEHEPTARFGELAVRQRFVTQKDVDEALAAQFGFSSGSPTGHTLPSEIVTAHNPFSPFAEALRGLRSQLMLRWFDGSPQQTALAMTSVDRADGKSFICSNLGVIFSQLGEKTLIIDADLRNSTQHLKFGLQNRMGLSGVLSGRAGIEEILAVPGMTNLALLPAGPIPPNPQELLGREDFGKFLAAMSDTFDVILIDTPSAQQASDAQVVAQRARAAVIVGRKDKTKSTEITQLGAVMTSAGVKLLGATLNEY